MDCRGVDLIVEGLGLGLGWLLLFPNPGNNVAG